MSSQKYAVCEVLLQMHLRRDRRTWTQQATSGVKIAGATVATAAALGLIASAYIRIARLDGGNHVTAGWLLLAVVTIVLSARAQYWGRWFYFLPGYVAMRSSIWMILGWFSPRGFIFVRFPVLMANDGSLELPIQQVEKGPCG